MRAVLALAVFATACEQGEPERTPVAPAFELREVVAPRLAALRAALPPVAEPALASASLQQELEPILGPLRSGDRDMAALVLEDARSLPPEVMAALVPVLRDASEAAACRSGVAEILANDASPGALEALLAAVEGASEPWLRAQCAYQLGRAGHDFVLPRLLLRLKYEKDFGAAFWIADTVSRLGHLAGVEGMLVVWSGTSDETLRAQAEQRLYELATERGCASAGEVVERWRAGTLPPSDPPFTPSPALEAEAWRWIEALGTWSLRTVDDARFALSRCEAWVVPLLVETLHESRVHVRQHAAQCLERMGPRARSAADALVAVLDEPRCAPAAAAALGALGAPASAAALERRLASPDPELRVAAAAALGTLAVPSSRVPLRSAFEGSAALDLKQAAAQALVRLEDARDALEFLLGCLANPGADAGAAELALGSWLARRAEREPDIAPTLERWRALDPAPGALPDDEALRRRREQRAVLVREALP